MKIMISGLAPTDQNNTLYNTIKRFEEDLLRRIPKLQTFSLVMEQRGFGLGNIHCRHNLDDMENHLTLTFHYRQLPTIEAIIRELKDQLKSLLQAYF
jgi:hypothetical protein